VTALEGAEMVMLVGLLVGVETGIWEAFCNGEAAQGGTESVGLVFGEVPV